MPEGRLTQILMIKLALGVRGHEGFKSCLVKQDHLIVAVHNQPLKIFKLTSEDAENYLLEGNVKDLAEVKELHWHDESHHLAGN